MRATLTTLLRFAVTLLISSLVVGCDRSHSPGTVKSGHRYHCPMHPTYVSDKPGDCPICGMRLVPINEEKAAPPPVRSQAEERIARVKLGQFYCPMGAEAVQDGPGKCPKCGMTLIEKTAGPATLVGQEEAAAAPSVPGRIRISLSPDKRQLIGLTLSSVKTRKLTRTVRTAAVVQHDETRYTKIAPRFAGWVRKLNGNFTGAPVAKGDPLFSVYSPELFSTENEYLVAWRAARSVKADAHASARESANALLESARLRLALFEIDEEEIKALEERGKPSAELLFRAPFSGHVLVKNAVEGKAFMAGESLYEMSDLSSVWLRASVFEYELSLIQVGQDAIVNFPYLNNESFPAKLTFIYPHIEAQTRRGEVRLELENHHHHLRPDMWANVEIEVNAGERLTVPSSSLIDTGLRYVAFVDSPDKHLEPREIKVGIKTDDYYEVLSGLKDGEKVVSRALFLVDSESQLKAAIAGMGSSETHQH